MKITHEGIEIEVYESLGKFWWYIESEDKNSINAFSTPDLALANARKFVNDLLQNQEDNYTNQLIS